MSTRDFPESTTGWLEIGRAAGFRSGLQVFTDPTDFYRLFRFDAWAGTDITYIADRFYERTPVYCLVCLSSTVLDRAMITSERCIGIMVYHPLSWNDGIQ